MRRLFLIAASGACACVLVTATPVIASAGSAAPRPSAAFAFKQARVDQHVKPVLTYRTAHLPRRSVIYLQRQYGSARVWKRVETLKKSAGTVTAPGVQMGKYEYRIWVGKSGRKVVTSAVHTLYSYGPVSLSTLCTTAQGFGCTPSTVQIGSTIFTYVYYDGYFYPNYYTFLQMNSTSCDSLTVQFATNSTTSGDFGYVAVIQSRSDPQYGSTPIDTIGTLAAKLDGGPFYLEGAHDAGGFVFINGTASCYTPSGTP